MLRIILRRLLWAIPILLMVSFLVFLLIDIAAIDQAVLLAGTGADPKLVAELRADMRLDDPVVFRYIRWLGDALQGDLGDSFLTRQPASALIWSRIPTTLSLTFVTLVIASVGGFLLGVVGALRPRGAVDRAVTTVCSLVTALPTFWLALLLVLYLSVYHRIFPAIGYVNLTDSPWEWIRHLILPALALSTNSAPTIALQLKGSLIDALGRDYILTARSKGLSPSTILFKHALRNAAIPVVTVLGLQITHLLGGAVVIEQVFAIRGLGDLLIGSAQSGDMNVLLGLVMVFTIVAILMNAVVDILYGYLNPKLRA